MSTRVGPGEPELVSDSFDYQSERVVSGSGVIVEVGFDKSKQLEK